MLPPQPSAVHPIKSRSLKITLLLSFTFLAFALTVPKSVAADSEYSFSVINNTKLKVVQVLVSQDKKSWAKFDLGSGGIPAGKTVKLVWDKSTDDQQCKQWVKAVYADGSEANPAQFDFCESALEIEFD